MSDYILDPDGHKLEIHVGCLETRVAECRWRPSSGSELVEDGFGDALDGAVGRKPIFVHHVSTRASQ